MTCVIYAIVIQGLRHLRQWRRNGTELGRTLVPILASCVLPCVSLMSAPNISKCSEVPPLFPGTGNVRRYWTASSRQVASISWLFATVPDHDPIHEWVYNRADIDAAKVVWAQDMGERNQELIAYFKGRRAWLLEPGESGTARLSPYPESNPR